MSDQTLYNIALGLLISAILFYNYKSNKKVKRKSKLR